MPTASDTLAHRVNSGCTNCPAGQYKGTSPSRVACTLCEAGKFKEELEADLRENRRAMQAALEGKSFADGDDPFEGMEPHEIEALLRQNAPDGDPYAGMAPEEINAYLAKQQEEQVGKHLSMPRNIPRPR
mgnify:CR=1 FL=1